MSEPKTQATELASIEAGGPVGTDALDLASVREELKSAVTARTEQPANVP